MTRRQPRNWLVLHSYGFSRQALYIVQARTRHDARLLTRTLIRETDAESNYKTYKWRDVYEQYRAEDLRPRQTQTPTNRLDQETR